MAQALVNARCRNHALREAVAKCLACGRFYCRECVTEHQGRVLCSGCLKASVGPSAGASAGTILGRLARPILAAAAFLAIWLFLLLCGQLLLTIPSSFHEGTLWEQLPWH